MKSCALSHCSRAPHTRGLCNAHALRLHRHGTTDGRNVMVGATQLERVLRGLPAHRPAEACWPWQRARNGAGYGIVSIPDGRVRAAHRVAYEELVGPVPPGLDLDHLCRNKPCCNPAHLEPVTRSENNRRMWPYRQRAGAAP